MDRTLRNAQVMNIPCPECGEEFAVLYAWQETHCRFTCPECGLCCFHADAVYEGVAAAHAFLRKFGRHGLDPN